MHTKPYSRAYLEKGLQRQIGVGTLISSHKRKVAVVPRMIRLSSGRCFSLSLYTSVRLLVLPKVHLGRVSSVHWGAKETVVFWVNRPAGGPSYLAQPRPAPPPRRAPLCR